MNFPKTDTLLSAKLIKTRKDYMTELLKERAKIQDKTSNLLRKRQLKRSGKNISFYVAGNAQQISQEK